MVQGSFRVMDLPPEVRNYIWRFAVVTDYFISIRDHQSWELIKRLSTSTLRSGKKLDSCRKDDKAGVTSILAIALTCRQVYLEVTPIYYSQNNFRLCYYYAGHRSLTVFTSIIGKKKAQSITSTSPGVVNDDTADFLGLPGLQRFDTRNITIWPYVWMEMINKRAPELPAKKKSSPILTEDGPTGCIESSATKSKNTLNGSNKIVSEKKVELKTVASHALVEES